MDKLKNKINAAMKKVQADLVLKNASFVNVFTQSIEKKDIAIKEDMIVGIGQYEGIKEIDCENLVVVPGFIDSHVHIESSMVTPESFSHLVIQKGVTTVIADPHEIANVMGTKGLALMLKNSRSAVMDIFYMLPSCVPAIELEDNGATLNANHLSHFINHHKILGLGEVMDVNSVVNMDDKMLSKIKLMHVHKKHIDGHAPKLDKEALNAYLCAGIKTDHECTEFEEALDKVRHGMYVMLREGSAARDLVNLLPAINDKNYHRFLFCTDDRHLEDLMEEGTIDHCVRLAVENGLEPLLAYTIASKNGADCFGLKDRGAIAPGLKADLVLLEDIEKVKIHSVIKNGKVYEKNISNSPFKVKPSIHINELKGNLFYPKGSGKTVNVIKVIPGSLKTDKVIRTVDQNEVIEVDGRINHITVIERHKNTGKYYTGYIEGLGLKDAAIAQSIAHDSHNIIALSDNERDMNIAVETLINQDGGIVFVSNGKILEKISLPIGGIMTDQLPQTVLEKMKRLNELARFHGVLEEIDPYITLSFMALPVIPELKITPRGLFDYTKFDFIDLFND